jgi:hypothetical protein
VASLQLAVVNAVLAGAIPADCHFIRTNKMIFLKAIGVTCFVVVLSHHVQLDWWEGCLLSFGAMLILG